MEDAVLFKTLLPDTPQVFRVSLASDLTGNTSMLFLIASGLTPLAENERLCVRPGLKLRPNVVGPLTFPLSLTTLLFFIPPFKDLVQTDGLLSPDSLTSPSSPLTLSSFTDSSTPFPLDFSILLLPFSPSFSNPSSDSLTSTSSNEDAAAQWMKGTVSAKINGVSPEKAWPFIEDFCNVYKVFPVNVSFCDKGDPEHVAVGHRRFMAFKKGDPEHIEWEKHHLVGIDRVHRVLTYRMMENNINFNYYRSIMTVLEDKNGCELRWEYVAQPKDYTPESLKVLLSWIVQTAATNIKNLAPAS